MVISKSAITKMTMTKENIMVTVNTVTGNKKPRHERGFLWL
jgi:hypothetical protein